MKRIKTALITFFLCFTSLYAAPKAPAWMLDVNEVYPSKQYIAQIGEGASREEAEIDAQARIARYFESNINTATLGKLEMSEYNGKVKTDREIDKTTKISSNVKLFAIHFSEPYQDKKAKKWSVVAYLDKDEAYQIFRPKVDLPAQNFATNYNKATKAAKNEDDMTAVKFLRKAREHAAEFEENYQFATLLNLKRAAEYDSIHDQVAGIDAKLDIEMQNCQLQISVPEDNNGAIAAKAKNLFSDYGFPVKSSKGRYVATVNVTLDEQTLAKGTACYPHVDVVITSQDGEAVISFGKDGQKISAANADVARRRAYTEVEKLLEEAFIKEFISE